jgi:hypothetical protein
MALAHQGDFTLGGNLGARGASVISEPDAAAYRRSVANAGRMPA